MTALTDLMGLQLAAMSGQGVYTSPYSIRYSHDNSNNILFEGVAFIVHVFLFI